MKCFLIKTNAILLFAWLSLESYSGNAQSTYDFYGHVMTDIGYTVGHINPQWFDVMRPTQLPSFDNQYGSDGNVYFSVRQSRMGTKVNQKTDVGDLYLWFEWELFGVGVDAGQTTFRLRHAYGQLGKWGVGQTESPFMDMDVFPNSLEYWGPNAMILFRNVQIRYMPIQGETRMTIALERPGASADGGIYADRLALNNVKFRFPLPDLSMEYRQATSFGYVELAGMLRSIQWEDNSADTTNYSGSAVGWGLNLSSTIRVGEKGAFKFQAVYGQGIQNYLNDGGVDIGIYHQDDNPRTPIQGKAMPVYSAMLFYDHTWSDKFTSCIGISTVDVDVTDAQDPSSFQNGQYGLVNLLYHPLPQIMTGVELQYGRRENFSDGYDYSTAKIQFSFKYNFDVRFTRP